MADVPYTPDQLLDALRQVAAESYYDNQLGGEFRCPVCRPDDGWVRGNDDPSVLPHTDPQCPWLYAHTHT
jgi:hypothetical protein